MEEKRENPDYRRVILHADDLGMNRGVTDGIMQGFRQGLLTSTSLLSNAPDAARALKLWKELIDDQAAARLPLHALAFKAGGSNEPLRSGRASEFDPGPASYGQELSRRIAGLRRAISRHFRPLFPIATTRRTPLSADPKRIGPAG